LVLKRLVTLKFFAYGSAIQTTTEVGIYITMTQNEKTKKGGALEWENRGGWGGGVFGKRSEKRTS